MKPSRRPVRRRGNGTNPGEVIGGGAGVPLFDVAPRPVTPMVDAVRSALTGGSHDLGLALIWSVALVAVSAPVAVLRYRRG